MVESFDSFRIYLSVFFRQRETSYRKHGVSRLITLGMDSALIQGRIDYPIRGETMDTILIVILVLLLVGGGGWGYSRRRR